MTENVDVDAIIGKTIADLREQRGVRQDALIEMLARHGVSWTRTVLSRVEAGRRALKWSEGLALAEALGVDPADLGGRELPDPLQIRIQRARIQYLERTRYYTSAERRLEDVKEGLSALLLAEGLISGELQTATVRGVPPQFVFLLGAWVADPDHGIASDAVDSERPTSHWVRSAGRRKLALDTLRLPVDEKVENLTEEADPDFEIRSTHYLELFESRYPELVFTAPSTSDFRFSVDNLDLGGSYGR